MIAGVGSCSRVRRRKINGGRITVGVHRKWVHEAGNTVLRQNYGDTHRTDWDSCTEIRTHCIAVVMYLLLVLPRRLHRDRSRHIRAASVECVTGKDRVPPSE